MNIFLDSSALVKRYVDEPGSTQLVEILASSTALGLSILAPTEVISALCRHHREGELTKKQYQTAKDIFFLDFEGVEVVSIDRGVIMRAADILEKSSLRSSDSLHIACAAEWKCDLFVSADRRQCRAARLYGLQVNQLLGSM